MDETLRQVMSCAAVAVALVPLGVCAVLWAKLSALRQQVQLLEARLTGTAREWWNWAQATNGYIKTLAAGGVAPGAGGVAPGTGNVAPAVSAVVPPVAARQAEPYSKRPTEHLREVVEDLRHRAPAAPPAHVAPQKAVPEGHATAMPGFTAAPQKAPAPVARRAPAQAKAKGGLEAYLGMKLFVVIGAIALALAAIFLVKIGIEQGYFGPLVRDSAMLVAGLALLGVAQWRRQHEGFWSQGMAAAGIIVLFATDFAATMLHNFLGVPVGFVGFALITSAAVTFSLQDWSGGRGGAKGGFLIATLGLVGGFLTPVLIHSNTANVPGLFGYLLLLHIGIVAATRLRGWSVLAALAMLGSSAWLILWMVFAERTFDPAHGSIYGGFLLASVLAVVLSTAGEPHRWSGGPIGFAAKAITWLAAGLSLVAACILLGKSNFLDMEWGFFAVLVAGSFVLGRLRSMYEGLAWLSSAAVAAMLLAWAGINHAHFTGEMAPADLHRLIVWVMVFGIGCTMAAYACQWKSAVPLRWAMLTVASGLVYVALAYAVIPAGARADAWAWLPIAAAVVFAGLAAPIFVQRQTLATAEESLAYYAHGILALLFAAPWMGNFHGGTLTALWAALLPVTALAVWRLRLPRLLIGFLCLTFVLMARGLMFQAFLHLPADGHTLFWNPIVWTYGSLIVAFALSAWMVERLPAQTDRVSGGVPQAPAISALLQTGAAAAGFLMLTFLVHWYFHRGQMDDFSVTFEERGTFAVTWLMFAAALLWMGSHLKRPAIALCGQVAGAIGMLYVAGVLMLGSNPLLTGEVVGHVRIYNELLYVYGVPALLCGLLSFVSSRGAPADRLFTQAAGITGMALLFVLVTLEVRQGFAAGYTDSLRVVLNAGPITLIEWGTYSVAWMTLGIVLLALGMMRSATLLHQGGDFVIRCALVYAVAFTGFVVSPLLRHLAVGTWPVLNDLLYIYGAPLLLAAAILWLFDPVTPAGRWLAKRSDDRESPVASMASLLGVTRHAVVLLAFIFVTTEVRQFFQHDYLDGALPRFVERASYPIFWLALAGILAAIEQWLAPAARRGAATLAWLGLLSAVGIVGIFFNPILSQEDVGALPIINWLLYAYGLPALAAGLIAWKFRADKSPDRQALAWLGGLSGLVLVFILVTLEVQQGLRHTSHLSPGPMVYGEMAAYSLAWAGLGATWLVMGILAKSQLFRWASLVMMLLTIFKVFLFDMTDLTDIQRVLSLAGLGVSLMALAFVYHRFVFRKEEGSVGEPAQTDKPPQGVELD